MSKYYIKENNLGRSLEPSYIKVVDENDVTMACFNGPMSLMAALAFIKYLESDEKPFNLLDVTKYWR